MRPMLLQRQLRQQYYDKITKREPYSPLKLSPVRNKSMNHQLKSDKEMIRCFSEKDKVNVNLNESIEELASEQIILNKLSRLDPRDAIKSEMVLLLQNMQSTKPK